MPPPKSGEAELPLFPVLHQPSDSGIVTAPADATCSTTTQPVSKLAANVNEGCAESLYLPPDPESLTRASGVGRSISMSRQAGCFLLGVVLSVTTLVFGTVAAIGTGEVRCTSPGPTGEVLLCAAGHIDFGGGLVGPIFPQVRS
jgi:hypothetical protein